MDSILKLVYDNWIPDTKIFLPNGIHPTITKEITSQLVSNHQLSMGEAQDNIRRKTEGNPFHFDHSNFIGYFMKKFGKYELVKPDEVVDDGTIYLLPLDIRSSTDNVCSVNKIKFKNNTIEYSLIDTFSLKLLELLQEGKVKILFHFAHDPQDKMSQLRDIENYFAKYNIDGSNIMFVPGNDCRKELKEQFPNVKLNVVPCRFMVSQQAALDVTSFPRLTSLGYVSDIVREADLDFTKIRPKKFLCFNRTMRPHRFMLSYLALKHKLLENSIFSFLNGFTYKPHDISYMLAEFTSDPYIDDYATRIHKLIPYELDTQHLETSQKSGFSTENSKKEWYESTYVHIISETRFKTGETPFISEKTWRPVANLQPFIFVGNYHSLRTLRELGFKTFSPFIDESYDEETDYCLRMKKIEEQIVKLNNMPVQELHDWYYSITDILLYNQNHLNTIAHIHPYEETYNEIIKLYKKEQNGI